MTRILHVGIYIGTTLFTELPHTFFLRGAALHPAGFCWITEASQAITWRGGERCIQVE